MTTLREGDRISNYLLEARLGTGSFGEVWRARHHVFADLVAIKVPTDPQYVRNLQREGVAVHGLHHPNIVRAIDLDPYADPPYFIMEYVDGPSLREVIEERKAMFPIPAAVVILRGILHGLTAAHRAGLVHRDLKPANILLDRPPEDLTRIQEQSIKITDFGLGHVGGSTKEAMVQSGSVQSEEGRAVAGTMAYMSPEQREGGEVDARSDLYACGIVLFEMLTGERPQGNEVPGSIRPGVPSNLDEVFQGCYTRRDRRFGSASEVLARLTAAPRIRPPARARLDHAHHLGFDCPACHGPVHRTDQFCISCGEQLVEAIPRCVSCHGFVRPDDRFCIFCGKDLRVLSS